MSVQGSGLAVADINQALADVYEPEVRQTIVIWPNVWRHDVGGDWHIRNVFAEDRRRPSSFDVPKDLSRHDPVNQ